MKKFTTNFALSLLGAIVLVGAALSGADPAAASISLHSTGPDAGLLFVGAGIIVNRQSLTNLFTGFKSSFQAGLDQADPMYQQIAMTVPSTTSGNNYGWMGKVPKVREWVGDRVVQNMMVHDYAIKNKDFELTIGVDRNEIEDDEYGIYGPLYQEMGLEIAGHPDDLVWGLLANGFATTCFDGQYFFDIDHPVLDANGNVTSVANTNGGAGTAWYLVDDTRVIKPILFQERKKADFIAMDQDTDEKVFNSRQFRYGTHARHNVGFGFWQLSYGSKQPLDAANFKVARTAMMEMKSDYGKPLKLKPRKLIVPPSLEDAADVLVNTKELAGGGSNPLYGKAEVVVVPWLV